MKMQDESFAEISEAQLAIAKAALECLNSEVEIDRIREHLGVAASAIERAFHKLP
jgi:predicted transcriptional regulator